MTASISPSALLARIAPPLIVWVFVVALTYLVTAFGSVTLEQEMELGLIALVVVMGHYMFVGLSGVISFGHIGFMAVGAYATALVSMPVATKLFLFPDLPAFIMNLELPPLIAIFVGGLVASVLAGVLAIPLVRLSGLAAALSTFASLIVVHIVALNWDSVTGGQPGVSGVPITAMRTGLLVWALVAMIAAYWLKESRSGIRLRASREDEVAAQGAGINIQRERGLALILSAFWVGVGGGLFAGFSGSFNPESFYLNLTFLIISMMVIGGMSSFTGVVLGALVVSLTSGVLRLFELGVTIGGYEIPTVRGLREIGLATLLLVILVLRPSGIMGDLEASDLKTLATARFRRKE